MSYHGRHGSPKCYSLVMTLKELQEQSRWLSRHASNITSEGGEDGIISKVLELLPEVFSLDARVSRMSTQKPRVTI